MMTQTKSRILIVDDEALHRGGLRGSLERDPRFVVVAEATNGHEALVAASFHRPDLALVNVELPGLTGLHVAAALRRHLPGMAVIFLSRQTEDERVFDALRMGASAFLGRATEAIAVVEAVEAVLRGENLMDRALLANPELTRHGLGQTWAGPDPWADGGEPAGQFSLRELQVLDCVVMGFTNREVGEAMRIAEQTVKNYMNAILRKLRATDRVAVLRHAVVSGWVNVGPRPTAGPMTARQLPRAHVISRSNIPNVPMRAQAAVR